MNHSNQTPEVLTRKEAASLIRVCLTSLDKMRLPVVRIGRRVFYRKTTLEAWLSANEHIKQTQGGKND
ncbi:MAG: helix-turn-helix domain-containing protein [Treponema sp.]|nr:helix-turn-helix domain-containing protein [Treponema sp.]